jgi:hypothetical protein
MRLGHGKAAAAGGGVTVGEIRRRIPPLREAGRKRRREAAKMKEAVMRTRHGRAGQPWTARTYGARSERASRRWAARLLPLLGAAALALVLASPAAAQTSTFTPIADAHVDATAASTNFGSASNLQVDGSPLVRTFIKFNLGATPPSSAALRIYSNSDSTAGFTVRSVSSSTWDESTITHNNAPAVGDAVASSGPIAPGTWYTLNISSLTASGGVVSLALMTAGSKLISLSSRESGRSPQVIVPAPASPSPFLVSRTGSSTYLAASLMTTTAYSGSLKSVVESAAADLSRAGGGVIRFDTGEFDLGNSQWELYDMVKVRFEGQGIDTTVIRNLMSSTSFDTEPFDISGAWGMVIQDLTVIAGGPERSTSDAIDFDGGNDSVVQRVKIAGARGRGLVFDGKDIVGGVARDPIAAGDPDAVAARRVVRGGRVRRPTDLVPVAAG